MCAAPTGSHFSAQGRSGNASKRPGESQYTAPSSPVQSSAEDTFTGMAAVSGFAGYEPNGSNSMPMRPVYPAPTSAGETEEFLAIASQGNVQQPQLTPTDNPVSAPANPLVAAKMANSAQTSSDAGLFPIQEVDKKNPGKNFDTTFSEPRSKKGGVVVAIVIILIVALVAGAYFYITNQEAAKAKEKLDSAIETLVSTDSVMSGVDAAVAQTISDGMASDSLSLALEQTTTTQNSLSSAETQANDALASRLTSEQSDAANAVLSSISARRSMLEAARQIQNASSTTAAAADTLDQVYALMDSAVSKYSYASQLWDAYLNGDEGINTQEIIDNETGAYNDTQQALQIVAQAKEAGTGVDYTVMETYLYCYADLVNARLTHNTLAIVGDEEGAEAQMDWFNAAAANLEAASATMPWNTTDYLAAYGPKDTSLDAFESNYAYARDKLLTADAAVAAYAGTAPAVTGSLPEAPAAPSEPAAADQEAAAQPESAEQPQGEEASAEGEAPVEGEAPAEGEEQAA